MAPTLAGLPGAWSPLPGTGIQAPKHRPSEPRPLALGPGPAPTCPGAVYGDSSRMQSHTHPPVALPDRDLGPSPQPAPLSARGTEVWRPRAALPSSPGCPVRGAAPSHRGPAEPLTPAGHAAASTCTQTIHPARHFAKWAEQAPTGLGSLVLAKPLPPPQRSQAATCLAPPSPGPGVGQQICASQV